MAIEVKYDPIEEEWYIQKVHEGDGVLTSTGTEFISYYPTKTSAIDMGQSYAKQGEDVIVHELEGGEHKPTRTLRGHGTRRL